jgi:MFS transporter, DHA3 family, macrolide efflux protein
VDVPTTGSAAPGAAARLWNRNFFLLWQGQTVSQLGNQAFSIAMMFWTMEATGSASLMGLLMAASLLPGVLLGPFGGTFADRHSRIRILVVCDVLAGLGVLGLSAVLFAAPDAVDWIVVVLFSIAVLGGIIRAFFMPAISAAIPDLVAEERLAAANSLNQFSVQASVFLGQAAGGVLYRVLGAPLLFFFDGLTFLFSAVSETFIRLEEKPRPREEAGRREVLRGFLRETGEGLRYLWGRTGMRDLAAAASVANFFFMPVFVLLPFYVTDRLGVGAGWYGFLMAALSAGTVAGFLLAGLLRLQGSARFWVVFASLLLATAMPAPLGFNRQPWVALAVLFVSGATIGLINVNFITLTQAATPAELRGRVMGLLGTVSGALMPLGMAVGGVVGDLTGKNVPLVYTACAALGALVVLLLIPRRATREFLAQE